MEFGWGPSLKLDVSRRSTGELKPKQEWDKLDNEGSEANAWALYNIFNRVSLDKVCRVDTYKHAKRPGTSSK